MSYYPNLFADARSATTVGLVAGVKLYRDGKSWRGECPLCHASKGSVGNGAFWTNQAQSKWMCFGGCADKPCDVIDLERRLRGGTEREAAIRLVRGDGMTAAERRERDAELAVRAQEDAAAEARKIRFRAELAKRLWREGRPAKGTLVEAYLRACGFRGWQLEEALKMVRFHPRAFHSGDQKSPVVAPAMIGLLMTPHGPTGGVHVTYLSADGTSKAALSPARKKWGRAYLTLADDYRVPGAVWLTPPTGPGPVLVGEGYETVMAGATLYGQPCRMVAALDLTTLQGRLLADDSGRVDAVTPGLDVTRPAFTWPAVESVIVCLDHDMNPIDLPLIGGEGERTRLGATDRALMCGVMAFAAWKASGTPEVRFALPPVGLDLRDQMTRAPQSALDIRELTAFDWRGATAFA